MNRAVAGTKLPVVGHIKMMGELDGTVVEQSLPVVGSIDVVVCSG
jgi:hypothetical protein